MRKVVYYSNEYLEHGIFTNIGNAIRKGVSKLKGSMKKNHKYLRRELMPNGKYKYTYSEKASNTNAYDRDGIRVTKKYDVETKKRKGVKYSYKELTPKGWRYYYENKDKTLESFNRAAARHNVEEKTKAWLKSDKIENLMSTKYFKLLQLKDDIVGKKAGDEYNEKLRNTKYQIENYVSPGYKSKVFGDKEDTKRIHRVYEEPVDILDYYKKYNKEFEDTKKGKSLSVAIDKARRDYYDAQFERFNADKELDRARNLDDARNEYRKKKK